MSSIKAVCFDLDGVYFTAESFKKFKEEILELSENKDSEKVNFVFHKSKEIEDFKRGQISEEDYWDFVKTTLGLTQANEEIFQLLQDCYQINQEVRNYVSEVKSKGILACACSNNFVTRIRELNNKFNFLNDFEVKIFSFEVGSIKPEEKIFQELINKSGVKPEEIVYSDDTEEKLEGAKNLGIKTFVFENFEQFKIEIEKSI